MNEFSDLGAFAAHLAKRAVKTVAVLQAASEAIGVLVEKTAKAEIGHYQEAVGPFPAWAELADSTKESRLAAGYTENDPLLASGELQESFSHQSTALEVIVGTPEEKMIYLEFGTSKMPPRPVLGPAVFTNKEKIEAIAGTAAMSAIFNSESGVMPVHEALGYNFKTSD